MTATVEELYAVIEEKEANLHLAAELGKALLEKNETLTKEFEQTTNSHRQQLERLKYENQWLKGKLASHSNELDDAMREHQEDIQALRDQLSAKAKQFAIQSESLEEKTQLAQQNQRLSSELDKALEKEKDLKKSIADLKLIADDLKKRNTKLSDEFDLLSDQEAASRRRLVDTDQKLSSTSRNCEKLTNSCDELLYKNTLLEREKQETLEQNRMLEKQAEILKDKNSELLEQLSELSSNTSTHSPSFLEELEYSQKSLTSGYSSNLSLLDELDSDEATAPLPIDNLSQLRIEVCESYLELQHIIEELESSECCSTETKVKVNTSKDIGNGELINAAKHVRYLVTRRHQMGSLLAQIAQTKSELAEKIKQIESMTEEAESTRRSSLHAGLGDIRLLSELREEKDAAVAACDQATTEISQLKSDNRRLENELLLTIQKKIKLSQQVEQWQLDMEEMVENQVRTMFLLEQHNKGTTLQVTASPKSPPEVKQRAPLSRSDSKRFSFFRRKPKE